MALAAIWTLLPDITLVGFAVQVMMGREDSAGLLLAVELYETPQPAMAQIAGATKDRTRAAMRAFENAIGFMNKSRPRGRARKVASSDGSTLPRKGLSQSAQGPHPGDGRSQATPTGMTQDCR
jgi:hypothetical protein